MMNIIEVFTLVNVYDYVLRHQTQVEAAIKESKITATPGIPGEEIVTLTSGNFKETTNKVGIDPITKKPDWIVTQLSGEKMIVKDSKFKELYMKGNNENEYIPKKTIRPIIIVNENIRFLAPWGTEQNLKKGGYLVILSKDNIYGIQKEEFEASYKKITLLSQKMIDDLLKTNLNKTGTL